MLSSSFNSRKEFGPIQSLGRWPHQLLPFLVVFGDRLCISYPFLQRKLQSIEIGLFSKSISNNGIYNPQISLTIIKIIV